MRRLLVGVAALLGAACAKEGTPGGAAARPAGDAAEPSSLVAVESAWTARSADGRFTVAQRASGGGCRLEARDATGALRWSAETCAAWRTDAVFVSPDGERVLVLHRAPKAETRDWSAATVATLLARGGEPRAFAGAELVHRSHVAAVGPEESWAWGLDPRSPGPRPAYAAGGERVRIETIDGSVILVGFDGSVTTEAGAPVTRATLAGPARNDEAGLYRWTDDAGEVHFGHGAAIPERYRGRAERVRGR